ncbi:hypothetical protein Nepgr_007581 [Nepenthes gracilis]|uniref:RRM domain-containing protein n=1 Tax=Nepenthes gracilis TaxID=150966 RepID=A0AAD3S7I3_NEPGR|nr:hypothetical protein Nepgr_007581 [Nepenthes gracilis]
MENMIEIITLVLLPSRAYFFLMNLSPPGNQSEDIKELKSAVDGALDLNSPSDTKDPANSGAYDGNDNFQAGLNEFDQYESSSLPAVIKQDDVESPEEHSHFHVQGEIDNDFVNRTSTKYNEDEMQSLLEDDQSQVEIVNMQAISFLHDGAVVFHANGGNASEDASTLLNSQLKADVTENERVTLEESPEMDRLMPLACDKDAYRVSVDRLQHELPECIDGKVEGITSTEQRGGFISSSSPHQGADGADNANTNHSKKSHSMEICGSSQHSSQRAPILPSSPATVKQKSVLSLMSDGSRPSVHGESSSCLHKGSHDHLYSNKSHEREHSSPPQWSGLIKVVSSHDLLSPAKETSASPKRGSQRRVSPPLRHVSPRGRKHGRRDRSRSRPQSRSRSPPRQRHTSSRYDKDFRDRPQSRSPHARYRRRRSPRYSPRRRSPPGYLTHRRSPRKRPWSPPPNRSTGLGKPGRHLFVAGFEFLTTERDLERKFSRFGHVQDVRIVHDKRTGDSRGFAFLSMERDDQADAAIKALDETEWNGRIILVEKSKTSGR